MRRNSVSERLPRPPVVIAVIGMMIISLALMSPGSAYAVGRHRPHMGSPSADQGTVYWNPKRNGWTVNRWSGCRQVVYWAMDGTIPAGWKTSIRSAVTRWDNSYYCLPDFIETTSLSAAKVVFRRQAPPYCNDSSNFIAIACRNWANSGSDQKWTVVFNQNRPFGVGVNGQFDVQSIATNEMGHVVYLDHNTIWGEGVVQANSCTWGSTSCLVTNDLGFGDFANYWTSCTNCGSRRTILSGDWAVVVHIYGVRSCSGVCPQ
jgi:hypothetical protein